MLYLQQRPRLGQRHLSGFQQLDAIQVRRVWNKILADRLIPNNVRPPGTGEELYQLCLEHGLDQAEVVFSIARENDDCGRQAIEKLIGKPIYVWRPQSRAPRPIVNTAQATSPRGTMPENNWIVLSVKPNPKKSGSSTFFRYKLWEVGKTIAECMKAGLTRADVQWDTDGTRKFVIVGPPGSTLAEGD